MDKENSARVHDVELTYITSRSNWYDISWKGNIEKSGGVATNIGVHFFDMLAWIFGDVISNEVHLKAPRKTAGLLRLKKASIRWYLSIDTDDLPQNIVDKGQRTYRSIKVNNKEIEFSGGFTDLHTLSYQKILNGDGYGLEDIRKAINIVHHIREAKIIERADMHHPFITKYQEQRTNIQD